MSIDNPLWGAPRICKYAPNIDPTSSSAHPVDIVRIFRMAEEPALALVATPHEAQKTVLDQTLRSKRQGDQYCARFYTNALLAQKRTDMTFDAAAITGDR